MGALAAMAGINLGTSSGEDALSPELYPDIVSSTPFLIELFDVKVKDQKAKVDTTLYAYLKEEQRSPWWSAIFSAPFKVLGWTLSLFKDCLLYTSEPGVTGFVKGHLGLFGAVCLHAPDLHESGAYGIEPDVLSAGGIFRSVIQTFGSGQAGFFTSFRRDGIDAVS